MTPQECPSPRECQSYHLRFKFDYGTMDDGTIWIRPPSSNLFHVDPLTLRIILELNSGSGLPSLQKKYDLSREELLQILGKLETEQAIVAPLKGRIQAVRANEDVFLTPSILLLIMLCMVQLSYFNVFASTFVMRSFQDALLVGIIAVGAVFFHEMGHYLSAAKYFKPRFGFMFLSVFPAVYVDTHPAWCLPRNTRMLINGSGLLADMLVNVFAIALVILYRPLEYFVTPFLVAQYTRLSVVLNPLFSGDGYWILSDATSTVNLTRKGFENLKRLRLNLFSFFGLISLLLTISSMAGFIWFLYNLFWKTLGFVKHYAMYALSMLPF